MGPAKYVIGFVPIYPVNGGYGHLNGHTMRMHWNGNAEDWLDGLVKTGYCVRWEEIGAADIVPAEYRGGRVFRCFRTRPTPIEANNGGQLVAVWESSL